MLFPLTSKIIWQDRVKSFKSLLGLNRVNCLFSSIVLPDIVLLRQGRQEPEDSVNMQEGDSVNLICKINEGLPEPQLSWYKNDVLLPSELKTTLILANVTDRDEGEYTCKAQNTGGHFTESINITVKSKLNLIYNNYRGYTNN